MRSSITTVIKTSLVITLYYYDITSHYIRYSGNNDEYDGTFQFTLKNKYGEI